MKDDVDRLGMRTSPLSLRLITSNERTDVDQIRKLSSGEEATLARYPYCTDISPRYFFSFMLVVVMPITTSSAFEHNNNNSKTNTRIQQIVWNTRWRTRELVVCFSFAFSLSHFSSCFFNETSPIISVCLALSYNTHLFLFSFFLFGTPLAKPISTSNFIRQILDKRRKENIVSVSYPSPVCFTRKSFLTSTKGSTNVKCS